MNNPPPRVVNVSLVKRISRKKDRKGKPKCLWSLRWRDPQTGKLVSETCRTDDAGYAEKLRTRKWTEINGLAEPHGVWQPSEPIVPVPDSGPSSWKECRDAIQRAMRADNLRPSSVSDALLLFDSLRKMFPAVKRPADITRYMANEYKRRRAEQGMSPWTVKGDLAMLKAVFGKWLGRECELIENNPFANVKPPRCNEPEIRIVSADESKMLFVWMAERWSNWKLPLVYLHVAALIGWRATEIASLRTEDVMPDGHIRVTAESSKTRTQKYGWLPDTLYTELVNCGANGWAFGRFSDELRQLLINVRKTPNHAARVREFSPKRLVGWMQDELQRFHAEKITKVEESRKSGQSVADWIPFTLHDFRRTAITGLQMAGASEKETSIMVGAAPEVIRKHYEKMDRQEIAKRIVQKRVDAGYQCEWSV